MIPAPIKKTIMKTYSVAVFDGPFEESIVIEGGLSYEKAESIFEELLKTNYGVEIIDDDPDNMEPIVLFKTQK